MARQSVGLGQKQQNTIIILSFFVYAMAYFGRYSFSSSINSIIYEYNIDKTQTGIVMTFFFVAYGIGQVINGFLCKYYPKRYIFPIALWSSSLINIVLFGGIITGYIGKCFYVVKYIWMLNGIVQSLIWTSLVMSISENIEQKNLDKANVALGLTVPIGTFVAYSTSSLMEHFGHYAISFVLAATLMFITGVAWIALFKPHKRTDIAETNIEKVEKKSENKVKNGLPIPILMTIISLSVFAISNNFIKDGFQTWIPTILKETYKFSNASSLILATTTYVLGVFGTLIARKLHSRIKDFIVLPTILFVVVIACLVAICLFLHISAISVILLFCIVMIVTYAVNNIVTSFAPLFLRNHLNSGVLAGILDGFCYVGSALTTYTLGYVADKYDWKSVFVLLLIIAVFTTVLSIALKLLNRRNQL